MFDFKEMVDSPLYQTHKINIEEISPEKFRLSMEYTPENCNHRGYIHGGILFTLADTCAGGMARLDGRECVTQCASINFHANVKQGTVYAEAEAVKRGKNVSVIRVVVRDENERLLVSADFNMYHLK